MMDKNSVHNIDARAVEDMELRDAIMLNWKDWIEFDGPCEELERYYPLPLAGSMIDYLNNPRLDSYKNVLEAEHYEILAAAQKELTAWEQLDAAIGEGFGIAYYDEDEESVEVLTALESERLIKILDIYEEARAWIEPGGRWETFIRYHKENSTLFWAWSPLQGNE